MLVKQELKGTINFLQKFQENQNQHNKKTARPIKPKGVNAINDKNKLYDEISLEEKNSS